MRNLICVALCLTAAVGCSDDEIDSDEQARRAYLALDGSIEKSIALGFTAFNKASSANIDPEATVGDAGGTLTIDGQVDSGMSANKGMRLSVAMVAYTDGPVQVSDNEDDTVSITFDTSADMAAQPYLNIMLQNFPNGTLSGSLTSNTTMTGLYLLSGDIDGELTLNLTIAGQTMAGATADQVLRVPGTTTIMGTATNSDGGVYDINITI